MCYCESSSTTLEASISAAGNKIPQLESQIKEGESVTDSEVLLGRAFTV